MATRITSVQMTDRLMKRYDRSQAAVADAGINAGVLPVGQGGHGLLQSGLLSQPVADICGHLESLETGDFREPAARADRWRANGRGAIGTVDPSWRRKISCSV